MVACVLAESLFCCSRKRQAVLKTLARAGLPGNTSTPSSRPPRTRLCSPELQRCFAPSYPPPHGYARHRQDLHDQSFAFTHRLSHQSLGPRHIFQQDGATAHTAAETAAWMDQCPDLGKRLAQGAWPPQSPDLNVIENFWRYITVKVQNHSPKSEKALIRAIRFEFAHVPTALCRTLINSVPTRLAQLINRGGAPSDY